MSNRDAGRTLRENKPVASFDDAVRFFNAKAPDGKCFACGTDSWNISTTEEDDSYCFFRKAGGQIAGIDAYNLEIECGNCGLIRSHRADVVCNWITENPLITNPAQGNGDD